MKKIIFLFVLITFVTACSNRNKEHLGLVRIGPNETEVMTNPPLVIPPDVNVTPIS